MSFYGNIKGNHYQTYPHYNQPIGNPSQYEPKRLEPITQTNGFRRQEEPGYYAKTKHVPTTVTYSHILILKVQRPPNIPIPNRTPHSQKTTSCPTTLNYKNTAIRDRSKHSAQNESFRHAVPSFLSPNPNLVHGRRIPSSYLSLTVKSKFCTRFLTSAIHITCD
jgi:hypothetical protein